MLLIERKQPNGEIEVVTPIIDDDGKETGEVKRVPLYVLNLIKGKEIVSDVSLTIDTDLYPPTMADMIARFERPAEDGYFDVDDPDTDFDEGALDQDDYVSEHEDRAREALDRINKANIEAQKRKEERMDKVDADMKSERVEAKERQQKKADDIKQEEKA